MKQKAGRKMLYKVELLDRRTLEWYDPSLFANYLNAIKYTQSREQAKRIGQWCVDHNCDYVKFRVQEVHHESLKPSKGNRKLPTPRKSNR